MAASTLYFLLFITLLTLSTSSSSHLSSSSSSSPITPPQPTAYDVLALYGLPRGLLPDSVTSYTISEDGDFEVHLENPCYIEFDYEIHYEKKITGKLNTGSITGLKGIQVKRFFFWFDVDEIRVDLPPSDNIYFTVGIINKKVDVDQFMTVRTCKDKAVTLKDQLPSLEDDIPMLVTV